MIVEHPLYALLLLPVGAFFWTFLVQKRSRWIRLVILLLLVLAAMGPGFLGPQETHRTIVLLDRSRSVGQAGLAQAVEWVEQIDALSDGPTWVLGFGRGAQVLARPADSRDLLGRLELQDDSELTEGLRLAAGYATPDHPVRVILLSDGMNTDENPLAEVATFRQRGMVIFSVPLQTKDEGDFRVTSLRAPSSVPWGQRYSLGVEIEAPDEAHGTLEVLDRGENVIDSVPIELKSGKNRFSLPLRAGSTGVSEMTVRLGVEGDPTHENNVGRAATRVVGSPNILVFNQKGNETALVRALRQSGLELSVQSADPGFSSASLGEVDAVVLEDFPLDRLGDRADAALEQYVRHMGGGLLITGGRSSFAQGGYFRSRLEDLLPVVMDRKEELRRPKVALGIVMDRSGSMSAGVGDGRTKMTLANRAAMEAVGFLAAGDEATVFAVDTAAHRVVPMTVLDDDWRREQALERIAKIESTGGGIFVYVGLAAGMKEMLKATAPTRHLVLFSDAEDSVEPRDYQTLVGEWTKAGGTLSVVGLGTETDTYAELLQDIARRGEGRIFFTKDALQLPRIFAQDIMFVARKTFIEKPAPVAQARGLLTLPLRASTIPDVGGYNLTYLAKGADLMLVTNDENQAPLAAAWQKGTGRVLTLTFQVDGPFTGALGQWDKYQEFLRRSVEWVKPQGGEHTAHASLTVDGRRALARVELDPQAPAPRTKKVLVIGPQEREIAEVSLRYVGPHTLEAAVPLSANGAYHGVVQLDDATLSLPPVALPYSPEFGVGRDPQAGVALLEQLSAATGGSLVADVRRLNAPAEAARGIRSLAPWLGGSALLLLLIEIAYRKGLLAPALQGARRGGRRFVAAGRSPWRREKSRGPSALPPIAKADVPGEELPESDDTASPAVVEVNAEPEESAFTLAKRRAKRKR